VALHRLTKWNAPYRTKTPSFVQFQSTPAGTNPFYSPDRSLKARFKRLVKSFRQPWHKSPMVYAPYIFLAGFEAVMLFTIPPGHGHAAPAFGLGLNLGFLFMTFLNRQSKKMDESLHHLEKLIMEREIEARVRADYEKNYAP
jgi:hypothetical protein